MASKAEGKELKMALPWLLFSVGSLLYIKWVFLSFGETRFLTGSQFSMGGDGATASDLSLRRLRQAHRNTDTWICGSRAECQSLVLN